MGGYLDTLIAVKALIARGEFAAVPRLVAAGPLLDGPRFRWSNPIAWHVEGAGGARIAVDSLKRSGVDFIKVYGSLPRQAYFAVAAEAKRAGLRFAGHVPTSIGATEASNAGQASFEHNGMWVSDGCVDDAATRINAALTRWTQEGYGAWFTERRAFHAARDAARCSSLRELFRTNGTWMVPTIVGRTQGRSAPPGPGDCLAPDRRFARLQAARDVHLGCRGQERTDLLQRHQLRALDYPTRVKGATGAVKAGVSRLAGFQVRDELLDVATSERWFQ